ncbi:MAG: HAD hydrolase-like protein [Flavobacteriales bacterium]|nr:HAD hydrolase-like protein [Flavobacteriales bacterium]
MNIIFDLDGTLIDSSKGILYAVELAFNSCDIEMKLPLTNELVGPPLLQLLAMVSGSDDVETLDRLAGEFKECYDSQGYKETKLYDGVTELLQGLKRHGFELFIATNKRMNPTQKIVQYFGWGDLFSGVYALDACPSAKNKAEMISYVLKRHELSSSTSIYVGDTEPDRHAAEANGLPFLMVSWGYEFHVGKDDHYVDSVEELMEYLARLAKKNISLSMV